MTQTILNSRNILDSLALLANSTDPQLIGEELDSIDLAQVYDLAIQHGIACQIHHNLVPISTWHKSDEINIFFRKLRDYYNHYTVASNFVDQEAILILRKLAKENIEGVALKGFALAHQVYAKSSLRPKTDIDILINAADKESVKKVLLSSGYSNPRGWEPVAISNQLSFKKKLGKGLNVYFDVHLKISNNKVIENIINYQDLMLAPNRTAIDEVILINKPYALLHAVLHLLNHQVAGDLVKMIWHYDIYLIVENLTELEHAELLTLCANKGMAHVVKHTLELTTHYFASSKLATLMTELGNMRSNAAYAYLLSNTSGITGFMMTLKLTDGLSNKLDVVRETAFPPAEEIYAKYGSESGWPLWLLYLRRMITGILKYSSKRQSRNTRV